MAKLLRRPAAVAAALALVIGGAFFMVAAATPSSASELSVMIENYQFTPAALAVHVGDTVTWTNMDDAPHTVTTSSGPVKISSPTLNKGDTFSFTFTQAGTYQYYCAVHPEMKASVTVNAGSGSGSGSQDTGPQPADSGSPPPSGSH